MFRQWQPHAPEGILQPGNGGKDNMGESGTRQKRRQGADQPARLSGTGGGKIADFHDFIAFNIQYLFNGFIQVVLGKQGFTTRRTNTGHCRIPAIRVANAHQQGIECIQPGTVCVEKHIPDKVFGIVTPGMREIQ
jgi:hypothetical protein